ncbi:hypothetical protein [Bdellovibrio sp. KM01]|uniref:hypothetical protein n=1 Tax=Bdellovibrio sp. KM01 TaxID=2748865 RepID=UPI0015E9334D|nr:hypothetical protein [Bdellovibrio sp. KM01]QLY24889.1 hypothetical protein HW988_15875 [Bdellovibrio sp. KM01]
MIRIKKLTAAIDEHFEGMAPSVLDKNAALFECSVMDMYQVTKIQKTRIELTHLFNGKVLYPVVVDCKILHHLRRKDTFLICLGLKGAQWHVIYMSPPYGTENV